VFSSGPATAPSGGTSLVDLFNTGPAPAPSQHGNGMMGGNNNGGMMGGNNGFGGMQSTSSGSNYRPVITHQKAPQPAAAAKDSWTQGLVNLDLGPKKPQQLSSGVNHALLVSNLFGVLLPLFSWRVFSILARAPACGRWHARGHMQCVAFTFYGMSWHVLTYGSNGIDMGRQRCWHVLAVYLCWHVCGRAC
jgi:hypothetical protein